MKNILLLLAFFPVACFGKTIVMGTKPAPNPKPFVVLKSGDYINANNVETHFSTIKADGIAYKKEDVKRYCDGETSFIVRGRDEFVPKIYEGKFNVYRGKKYSSSRAGGTSTINVTYVDYIEISGTNKLMNLTVGEMKVAIPRQSPAFEYVKRAQRNEILGTSEMIVGGIASIGAFALLFKSFDPGNTAAMRSGKIGAGVLVSVGVGGFVTGAVTRLITGKTNLKRAVASYNGVYPELGK